MSILPTGLALVVTLWFPAVVEGRPSGAAIARRPDAQGPQQTAARTSVPQVRVPDLTGRVNDVALRAFVVDTLRLRITIEAGASTAENRGRVIAQRPRPDTVVPLGAVIQLIVGSGIPQAGPTTRSPVTSRVATPTQSRLVDVPSVVGLDRNGFLRALEAARLTPGVIDTAHSDVQPRGLISSQKPAAGERVPPGTRIAATFSTGPPTSRFERIMPNLLGLAVADALDSLNRLELTLDRLDSTVAPGANGTITAQYPAAGAIAHAKEPVRLRVAFAPERIDVPRVVGLAVRPAVDTLRASGLVVTALTEEIGASPAGIVTAQDPAAGSRAQRGSGVRLTVSKEAARRRVRVPDVLQLRDDVAKQRLVGSLVTPVVTRAEAGEGTQFVITQFPAPDTEVDSGATVELTTEIGRRVAPGGDVIVVQIPEFASIPEEGLSEDVPEVAFGTVPSVLGLSFSAARDRLAESGFTSVEPRGAMEAGAVVNDQDPRPGTRAPVLSVVVLVMTPSKLRDIPDLTGLDWLAAVDSAGRVDLTATALNATTLLRWRRVTAQDPAPGFVVENSVTTIGLSLGLPIVPLATAGAAVLFGVLVVVTLPRFTPRRRRVPRSRRRAAREKRDLRVEGPLGHRVEIETGPPETSRDAPKEPLLDMYLEVRFEVEVQAPQLTCKERSILKLEMREADD